MLYLKFRLKVSLTALFFLTLFLLIPFPLCAQSAERPIRVAARVCPPFVMNDAGQYSGISIYLWDKIAEKKGFEYSIEEYGLNEMLEAVVQGKADIAGSCLSMTQKREEIIDFSHPFFETHLAIAVKQQGFLHTLVEGMAPRYGLKMMGHKAKLELGNHKISQEIAELNLSKNSLSGQHAEGMMSKLYSPDRHWDANTLAAISG